MLSISWYWDFLFSISRHGVWRIQHPCDLADMHVPPQLSVCVLRDRAPNNKFGLFWSTWIRTRVLKLLLDDNFVSTECKHLHGQEVIWLVQAATFRVIWEQILRLHTMRITMSIAAQTWKHDSLLSNSSNSKQCVLFPGSKYKSRSTLSIPRLNLPTDPCTSLSFLKLDSITVRLSRMLASNIMVSRRISCTKIDFKLEFMRFSGSHNMHQWQVYCHHICWPGLLQLEGLWVSLSINIMLFHNV